MIAFKMLTGKLTGKIPLGSRMRKSEDNIGIDLKEIKCQYEELDWFGYKIGIIGETFLMLH
jgi:hypothetical protein